MIYVRSFFANLAFYIVLVACCLVAPISFILPKTVILQIIRFQSIHTRISLKLFANLEQIDHIAEHDVLNFILSITLCDKSFQ